MKNLLRQKTSEEMLQGKTQLSGVTKINCKENHCFVFTEVLFFKMCFL